MVNHQQFEAAWTAVKKRLRLELGDNTFQSWIRPLSLLELRAPGTVVLGVPTSFMRDYVRSHFADRLTALWRTEEPEVGLVDFMVTPRMAATAAAAATAVPVPPPAAANGSLPLAARAALPLAGAARPAAAYAPAPIGATAAVSAAVSVPAAAIREDVGVGAPLDPRFTFDNFVVGKSNELAHAAARRVAEGEAVKFNPLFLYGGVGLGKTHLMHAIAWALREKAPEKKVIYLSAEKFMYQFIRALRFKDTMAFKEQFRSVDILMIDDVQFISGKDSTQEEFFHTFNALVDHNRQVIISADRSPTDLEGIEERIRSRLGWGLVADIHPTDYELRLGILEQKIEGLGPIDVPRRVLEFLAHRITSNVRELEGALNRVVAFAELVGRPVTIDMAQEVLQDLLRANDRRVTIEEIQRKVADYYGVRLNDLLSARRARVVARPRQVAMYLAKQLTSRSLPEIGRKFGGRDHTTVIHAVRKIEELCAADSSFHDDIDSLRRMLEA
ncbi:chromosomal replication initiator protein DnaA [Zavarzinia compransoris]|uniref:Chromosomal replication initiator protein DnaA n=1 Tax=Zavarzinia compransoris TaxID=1264899 RepID=A0A317E2U8_9PROT|nr:chromosomal replication initiator protein DnaA [Zavarzinia compransoris]PWR20476.1 chromosomal replication initiator protein DnaA [Zavarzinia compransoris]TDP43880.1 chromosomal replication initiator protein DnaA [Zavarzinia compransoris]